jgi:3'(2'), 5'-bisphosphate nucleotidase
MFSEVALQQMPEKLQQLCKILQHASTLLADEYALYQQGKQFHIEKKQDNSPVTQADLKVHAYMCVHLGQLSPHAPILSEEGEQHAERLQWRQFWMLDPLDGTKEFIHQTGEFTINLSWIDGGESVISAIAVPLKQTIYISEKGDTPFRWQWQSDVVTLAKFEHIDRDTTMMRIAMSRRPERSSLYAAFLQYLTEQQIRYEKVAAGSAYKFCMMLESEIDIYPRFHPTSEWDTAAGQGLLQSIGGDVFDLRHRPFQYNQRADVLNGHFIALRRVQDWQYFADFFSLNC